MWKYGNWSVANLCACAGNLLVPHLAFCLEEVALLVSLDGEHPSSGHIVLRFDVPHVNDIENLIVNPGTQDVSLQQTVCSILLLPELMLLFVHEISSLP